MSHEVSAAHCERFWEGLAELNLMLNVTFDQCLRSYRCRNHLG